jgi:hypothetical protein
MTTYQPGDRVIIPQIRDSHGHIFGTVWDSTTVDATATDVTVKPDSDPTAIWMIDEGLLIKVPDLDDCAKLDDDALRRLTAELVFDGIPSPDPHRFKHPTYGSPLGREVRIGDTITCGSRIGTVEKIDPHNQGGAIGVRWTDGRFNYEHPKGIVYVDPSAITIPVRAELTAAEWRAVELIAEIGPLNAGAAECESLLRVCRKLRKDNQ